MNKTMSSVSVGLLIIIFLIPTYAAPKTDEQVMAEVAFSPILNAKLPPIWFSDINGRVELTNLLTKGPSLLTFAWFDCSNLCGLILNGVADSSAQLQEEEQSNFQVIVVSMDDTASLSEAENQQIRLDQQYPNAQIKENWQFLIGSAVATRQLAEAIGYHFFYDDRKAQFAHPAGVVAISKDGYVRDFRSGINYRAKDIEQLLMAANSGVSASPKANPLLLLCYDYDPSSGRYSFAIIKLLRGLAITVVVFLVGAMFYWQRKRKRVSNE